MQAPTPHRSSPPSARRALVVGADDVELQAIRSHLGRVGYAADAVDGCRRALRSALPDVAIVALALPDGRGLDLIKELKRRSPELAVLAIDGSPSYAELRAAAAAGASDLLIPNADGAEWDRALAPAALPSMANKENGARLELVVAATREAHDAALAELLAFAMRGGCTPAVRARLATAAAELLENVRRHCGGSAELRASRTQDRLSLELRDGGTGFDAPRALIAADARLDEHGAPAPSGGLARVQALVERFTLESDVEGTRAHIEVEEHPGSFADVDAYDLSDRDYLDPGTVQALLQPNPEAAAQPHLSPALSIVLGRLLSPRAEDVLARACLWSRAS